MPTTWPPGASAASGRRPGIWCPSLGRADRPADATRQGGFLHLGNWRNHAFIPATRRAGLTGVIPYNGRDTFASLLIYEGRPPILVAAALGHGDTQTLWRHYPGVFAEAEHVARMPIDEAARRAREQLRSERNVPTSFPRAVSAGRIGATAVRRFRRLQAKFKHARQDSNLRPLAPEASALSTELRALWGLA